MATEIILASASPSRTALLRNAGVPFTQEPASVDEEAVKASFRNDNGSAAEVAEALAELKAERVSRRYPGRLVVGADQMLECGGVWFDKPTNFSQARGHLLALRGKTHELLSAVCVVRDGECLWRHLETAQLTMRPFTDVFLDEYLAAAGETVLSSVGAYRLEDRGAQLFSRIEGDYFTILGLPLLPLLGFLCNHGVVTA